MVITAVSWPELYARVADLKLDIIHKIIENLNHDDLVNVMEQALNVEDLDFTIQRRVQYEVLCTSQNQRIDYLNHYLRGEGAETLEIKTDTKLTLHNQLYHFCVRNPEKERGMLLDQLRQISTLKAFNALARQIGGLSVEGRNKLGDDAIQYHERRHEVDPKYWLPWRCL
ncbi:putative ankyrin repeat protein PAE1861 [Aspergillus udagawae]|uniref:Putative ankyrin repeat protein PAE1861 n=1 Tax=Aspergillus udagawae TaxID=91492 RepID=A0A8H3N4T4_9EURO|nr:putative ankyrin repeat protein PAE1861 [Aspergillus udagawae]